MKYIIKPLRGFLTATLLLLFMITLKILIFVIRLIWTFSIKDAINTVKEYYLFTDNFLENSKERWYYKTYWDYVKGNKQFNNNEE